MGQGRDKDQGNAPRREQSREQSSGRLAAQQRPFDVTDDETPAKWFIPFLEARYTKLAPKPRGKPAELAEIERSLDLREEEAIQELRQKRDGAERPSDGFRSMLQPGRGEEVIARVPPTYWHDVFSQYQKRRAKQRRENGYRYHRIDFDSPIPPAPGVLGVSNWIPIGPSVARRGQPTGRPAISGRTNGIAIAPGETRVYVCAADGGVWRSDDTGNSWYSTMDNFDVDPTVFAGTSLACGAIAIDLLDPDRVYVGTGEGDTNDFFSSRLTNALPTYRGIGPLRSDNGGGSWTPEPNDPGSPTLMGSAFYALAVDPADRENVVAATNVGLYRREPDGAGNYHWVQKRVGVHSSVMVANTSGVTTFFASAWGDKVYLSHDGSAWTVAGTGFPAGATRIGLAVQRANPNVVYAMVANASFALLGVYRLDNATGAWRQVSGAPASVLGQQGDYDLTIAVDPNDTNTIFMGGQAVGNDGAIYRAFVSSSMVGGSLTYSMVPTFVGADVHADVHAILYSPSSSSNVWTVCDGGVFKTDTATGASTFQSRNVGLATLMSDFLSQHPTQSAVIFCGLQDNGTVRYMGEECWTHVFGGDGGYCVVNWNDPFKVLVYADGSVLRATDGGVDYSSWANVTPPGAGWIIMAQPIVSAPNNPANPADADVVAYGAGNALFISSDFGGTWSGPLTVSGGGIFSMIFASASRLFVGMTGGRVYRYDLAAGIWNQTRIDNAAAGPLPLTGIVSDIEVDPADASGQSIFITFGGTGDYRHVWRFNGTSWQARSGPTPGAITSLLDVEHNAVIADPVSNTLYVGADIGVWKSTDGGMNWSIIENGLPDAAVLDLQLHAPTRLLRAALHGRGVYELKLDPPTPPDVELYVRDTTLDVGRMATVDGLNDPSQWPIVPVHHWESVNIRVDVPTPAGYQTPTPQIDFYQFNDKIVDGSSGVATIDPSTGTVFNRVYVEVHNRGIKVAPSVQVMLLLTDASTNLNPLPAGYTTNVQNGMPISTPQWQTVGIKTVTNLKVGFPQIVEFNLPSTMLPPPASLPGDAHFCTVALLHSSDDPYTNTITDVDALTVAEHKVCQRNLNIVQFVGTPPPPGIGPGRWGRIVINAERKVKAGLYDLVLDLNRFTGKVGVLLPKPLMSDRSDEADELRKGHHIAPANVARDWAKAQQQHLERFMKEGRFSYEGCKRMLADIAAVEAQPLIIFDADDRDTVIHHLSIRPGHSHSAFLWIEPSPKMEIGSRQSFTVILRDAHTQHTLGGSTYQVQRVSIRPSQAS